MSKLYVDIKVGETLIIGNTQIILGEKSGQRARLEVIADPETKIITPKQSRMSVSQSEQEQHG